MKDQYVILSTIFEKFTIVTFKKEEAVVMWLHSNGKDLEAYLAVLKLQSNEKVKIVEGIAEQVS